MAELDNSSFAPLHVHSFFSVLDGLCSPEAIAKTAKALGHKACALTDHGSCGGLYRFQKACKAEGIKPILGMEAYVVSDPRNHDKDEEEAHATIWAKNRTGLLNLFALSSRANIEGFYRHPRVSMQWLAERREGLMLGSACVKGIGAIHLDQGNDAAGEKALAEAKDIFGDDFYVEVMHHTYHESRQDRQSRSYATMKKVLMWADAAGVKPVFTYDSHYCTREQAEAHDVLLSVNTGDNINNPERFTFASAAFYMRPVEDMLKVCARRPELISNTMEIADKVEGGDLIRKFDFNDLLPTINMPPGSGSERDYLVSLIRDGMVARRLSGQPKYEERLEKEINVISKCGFVRYFLVLWDLVQYAKRQGIRVGPGRGSGAACLCLYAMGITHLDPVKHDLMFERFLNPSRVSPPDVDLDFEKGRRAEMFKYLTSQYGAPNVARIGTYGTMGARDSIRKVAKAIDVGKDWERAKGDYKAWDAGEKKSAEIADVVAKSIPDTPKITIESALEESKETKGYSFKFPKLFELAQEMEGVVFSQGIHASGVVVATRPLVEICPLRVNRKEGEAIVCTQFDMTEVEELGLLKYDVLGLVNMDVVERCVKLIRSRTGREVDVNALETDDKAALASLNRGEVEGVFQFEGSPGIAKTLKGIGANSFDDLVVTVAMYRPGPKDNIPDFCDFKHGRKPITYVHPMMKDLLSDTYGMMCFDGDQKVYGLSGPIRIGRVEQWMHVASSPLDKPGYSAYGCPESAAFMSGRRMVHAYGLSDGSSVSCTNDHRFRLFDGSYVPISRILRDRLALPVVLASDLPYSDPALARDVKMMTLVGLLIGDGSLDGTPVCCVGSHRSDAEATANLFADIYGSDAAPHVYWHTRSWYVSLGFASNKVGCGRDRVSPLIEFLKQCNIYGKDWSQKRMPFHMVADSRSLYLALLAGMVDSDGHVGQDIFYSSKNPDLLDDFAYALWRLGYPCYRSGHAVHVRRSDEFFLEIQPFLTFKKHCNVPAENGFSTPLATTEVAKFLKGMIGSDSVRSFCQRHRLNRQTISRILVGHKPLTTWGGVKKLIPWKEAERMLAVTVDSDKKVGVKIVYDMTVKKSMGSNFVVAPGVIAHNCYQEQVMLISMKMAGFDDVMADKFRKGIGKKKPEIVAALKPPFISGCLKNGVDQGTAEAVFALCEKFAGYGFNKAHAASYAFVGYQDAWLKAHYPLEFMSALMTANIGDEDKIAIYSAACRRMGIKIEPVDVNRSGLGYEIEGNGLRSPLSSLKGIGSNASDVVSAKPFKDLADFCERVSGQSVNRKSFEILVSAGAFDCLGMSKVTLMESYDRLRDLAKKKKVHEKKYSGFSGGMFTIPV